MNTLLLDVNTWDLVADAAGNIAMASEPYALAQDVASAVKLFAGELWYQTDKGVPYWEQILGHQPPMSLIEARCAEAAMTVPGVVSAQCIVTGFSDRQITGQLTFTDTSGVPQVVSF